MDVKDLGDGLIYLGYLAGALTAIAVVLRFAVIGPFRRFIERTVTGVLVEIRDQLASYGDLSKRLDDHLAQHHAPTIVTDAVTGGYHRG